MSNTIFLSALFIPFVYSLYLIFKRLILSPLNKNLLDLGLLGCTFFSLVGCAVKQFTAPDDNTIFLLVANFIFFTLCLLSYIFFKLKKQFMFTKLRYYIFLSLFMSVTYCFILSENFVLSTLFWILSGVVIYIFSYFDIFKINADYNPNRFYSVFLIGDFSLLLSAFILVKYAIISENFSYFVNFSEISSLTGYIIGNSSFEYLLLPVCLIIALFSRAFIFPFSCFFSFLSNASNLLYSVIYSTMTILYSLVLFLKLDLFSDMGYQFKIYIAVSAVISILSLLFEKHFKIILGHLLSIINCVCILTYFYNKYAFLCVTLAYIGLILALFGVFLQDKLSFRRRIINIKKGFLLEKMYLFLAEKLPLKIADLIYFVDKKILNNIVKFVIFVLHVSSYYYMKFIQRRDIPSVIKGIIFTFTLFALLSIFIALFGSFGEMQS